jgi:hypothetical protein
MKTVVVDSHNEVLPYWFEEYLKLKLPLVVIRIDQHHDMNHECPVLPAREGRHIFDYLAKIMPYISEYAKRKLNEGNFTCPAFHYGIVAALYHFNPRGKKFDAYGRVSGDEVIDAPRTTMIPSFITGKRINRIVWDEDLTKLRLQGGKIVPVPQNISINSFRKDIEECNLPVVIGFDLDGIYGVGDKGQVDEIVRERLEGVGDVLDCVSAPVFACIARSQTPRTYVPPELVDHLQQIVLTLMERRCIWSL